MSRNRGSGYRADDSRQERSVTAPAEQAPADERSADRSRRVIVLPDVAGDRTLVEEFGGQLPLEMIERVAAAARHALERSHQPVTPEAVHRLAREHLRARMARLSRRAAGRA